MAKNVMDLIASLEEEEVKIDASTGANGELDVVETVEADGEIAEAGEAAAATDQISEGIDTAAEEGEVVEEQIAQNEEILADPESKTEEEVEVAITQSQEALNDALFIFGGKNFRNQNRVSLEGIETNIEKLRYATEGLKDFAKNAWEKIKELFTKFITFFKRLAVKIGAWFDQGEKKAKGLAKRIREAGSKWKEGEKNLTDDFREKLAAQLGAGCLFFANKLGLDLINEVDSLSGKIDIKAIQKDGASTQSKSYSLVAQSLQGFSDDWDKDEGEKGFAAFIVGKKAIFLSNFGNTQEEEVDTQSAEANLKKIDIKSAEVAAAAVDELGRQAKGYSKFVTNTFKSLDKALKDAEKEKGQDLKGSDYEDKVDIRKDFTRLYKVLNKTAILGIKTKQTYISSGLTIFSQLYRVATRGKGVEENKTAAQD